MSIELKQVSPFDELAKTELITVKNDGIVTLVYKCEETCEEYTTDELDEVNLKLIKEQQ